MCYAMTIVSPLGRLFKQMLPIKTTYKMFKLIKGVINRVNNILNNKNKGFSITISKHLATFRNRKKKAQFNTKNIIPKINQKISIIRINAFNIKNIFDKMPIIQKEI